MLLGRNKICTAPWRRTGLTRKIEEMNPEKTGGGNTECVPGQEKSERVPNYEGLRMWLTLMFDPAFT